MPLFLIPLAFSLFSAAAGVIAQQQDNERLEVAGEKAITDQLAQNEAARVDEYSTYITAIDEINSQRERLANQADVNRARTKILISNGLYVTAILMALLTVFALLQRKPISPI